MLRQWESFLNSLGYLGLHFLKNNVPSAGAMGILFFRDQSPLVFNYYTYLHH